MATRFIVRRFGQAALTIFLIVLVNFVLFRAMPGSPERILARNPNVSPEAIQQTRERWGIDKPLIPDQLIGDQRLVDAPSFAGLLDRLRRDVRVTGEDPLR